VPHGAGGDAFDENSARPAREVIAAPEPAVAQRAHEILESITDAFFAVDHESRLMYVNRHAQRLLDAAPDRLLGAKIWELYPALAGTEFEKVCRKAADERLPSTVTAFYPDHDRWYEVHAYPTSEGVAVYFQDVTDRTRWEQQLRESEERYRQAAAAAASAAEANAKFRVFFEQGTQFAGVLTLEGVVVEANRLCLEYCGFQRADVLGKPFWECGWWGGSPALVAMVRDGIEQASSGHLFRTESAYYFADGSERAVDLVLAPVTDGAGRVLFVAATGTDITERKRSEATLRENQDVLALAMRGGRMGYWSRNLVTNKVWWSPQLEELFGMSPGAFAGTLDGFHTFVHPDDRRALNRAVESAIASRTDYLVEFRFRTVSGQWRWMDGRGRAVYAQDGTPTMLYGLGIDITARKQSEKALAGARDAAESANRLKDQFLATLSHELRTPLNAILGYARMLQSGVLPPDKHTHAIEVIERNAIVQTQLVEELLDVSRISSGKIRLDPDTLLIEEPLREALESARPAADAKQLEMDVTIDPAAGLVHADPTRLQQVFRNLLSNAVKFTQAGGRIRVTLAREGDYVVATVADSGIGIDPEFLPHVFEPFRQAEAPSVSQARARSVGAHGGLGLGLAICRQLVELQGGTITVASAGAGHGATFSVRLPRRSA
jgi:PAS domain S-box-containing protein